MQKKLRGAQAIAEMPTTGTVDVDSILSQVESDIQSMPSQTTDRDARSNDDAFIKAFAPELAKRIHEVMDKAEGHEYDANVAAKAFARFLDGVVIKFTHTNGEKRRSYFLYDALQATAAQNKKLHISSEFPVTNQVIKQVADAYTSTWCKTNASQMRAAWMWNTVSRIAAGLTAWTVQEVLDGMKPTLTKCRAGILAQMAGSLPGGIDVNMPAVIDSCADLAEAMHSFISEFCSPRWEKLNAQAKALRER
jgi:hypothetical protein